MFLEWKLKGNLPLWPVFVSEKWAYGWLTTNLAPTTLEEFSLSICLSVTVILPVWKIWLAAGAVLSRGLDLGMFLVLAWGKGSDLFVAETCWEGLYWPSCQTAMPFLSQKPQMFVDVICYLCSVPIPWTNPFRGVSMSHCYLQRHQCQLGR